MRKQWMLVVLGLVIGCGRAPVPAAPAPIPAVAMQARATPTVVGSITSSTSRREEPESLLLIRTKRFLLTREVLVLLDKDTRLRVMRQGQLSPLPSLRSLGITVGWRVAVTLAHPVRYGFAGTILDPFPQLAAQANRAVDMVVYADPDEAPR